MITAHVPRIPFIVGLDVATRNSRSAQDDEGNCYPSRRMYPTLLRVGNFEITTFGLMMFIAFIVGGWVLTKQYRHYGLSEDFASSFVMAGAIGGIVGAKIYYAILFRDWRLLFDRAGLVWYGGMIGG